MLWFPARTPIDSSVAEPFDPFRLDARIGRHHGPKASSEDAVEFLHGNSHGPETGLHIGNPPQNAFPNGTFLQPEVV